MNGGKKVSWRIKGGKQKNEKGNGGKEGGRKGRKNRNRSEKRDGVPVFKSSGRPVCRSHVFKELPVVSRM